MTEGNPDPGRRWISETRWKPAFSGQEIREIRDGARGDPGDLRSGRSGRSREIRDGARMEIREIRGDPEIPGRSGTEPEWRSGTLTQFNMACTPKLRQLKNGTVAVR